MTGCTQTHEITDAQRDTFARMVRGRTLGEFVFDVHAHTCDGWGLCCIYDGSREALQHETRMLGSTGMAVSAVCAISGIDFRRANDALARDIGKDDNKLAAYVGIDIRHGRSLVDDTAAYIARGFKGGKLYTRWGVPYDDDAYHPVLDYLNQLGAPVLAHCWGGRDITQLVGAARKFPRIRFIAAHTGSPDVDTYIRLAKETDNLYIDTAYSRGQRGLIEYVVQRLGSEKLLFGSDAALFSAAQQVARVVAARISDEDRRNILGRNALRLFKHLRPDGD